MALRRELEDSWDHADRRAAEAHAASVAATAARQRYPGRSFVSRNVADQSWSALRVGLHGWDETHRETERYVPWIGGHCGLDLRIPDSPQA
eukprot:4872525-Prymnesium_polylepis.1